VRARAFAYSHTTNLKNRGEGGKKKERSEGGTKALLYDELLNKQKTRLNVR
jgi:hypothetical protein